MGRIFLILTLLFLTSCNEDKEKLTDATLTNATRNNCVDLDFNNACEEVSKRGLGRKSCKEDEKCNLVCKPLDKEIHKECCYDNDTYSVFLKKEETKKEGK
jgi:hypothetical protein